MTDKPSEIDISTAIDVLRFFIQNPVTEFMNSKVINEFEGAEDVLDSILNEEDNA